MILEKQDMAVVVLTILFLVLYLSTLSISLDDEDSVHFALGLDDFNVTKYQPHPPGFPVYMAIGMLFNSFLGNPLLSLTLMSAIFGAGSFLVFYILVREMFNRDIAIMSSVMMAITPLFWLNSVKAMSDVMGLFFTLVSMVFIYKHIRHGRSSHLYIGAALVGISLGVRIHSAFILLPILAYGLINRKNNRKNSTKICLGTISILVVAVLIWLIPLFIVTGVPEYMSATGDQLAYRIDRPDISVIGSDVGYGDMTNRILDFPFFFLLGGYGINIFSLGVFSSLLLFLMIVLLVMFIKRHIRTIRTGMTRDSVFKFFLLGIIPYLAVILVSLPPFNPRYLIILTPLLSLIFVLATQNIRSSRNKYLVYMIMLLLLISHSVFLVNIVSSTPSPPVQLVNYVNQNYGAGDSIVLDGFALKYFIYYQTELTMLPASEMADCDAVRETLLYGRTLISNSPMDECEGLRAELVSEFQRDPRVHIKRSNARLYQIFSER